MWTTEHTGRSPLPVEQIWRTLVDVHAGRLTLPGGDVFEPDGELAVGTRIAVTPAGQDRMISTVTEFDRGRRYADVTEIEGITLTFSHDFRPDGAGTVVTHRLRIDGPGADGVGPELGPQISADFPEQLQALFAAADGRP